MYLYDKNRITYFAETDRRNKRIPFGIKADDRTRHMYIIGKTGMGKSTLIENMVAQDIKNGEGFAFIDPHGKSAALLLDYVPPDRIKDVVYLAPFDMDHPISFNVMEDVGPDKRHLVANGLMSAFKKIWGPETWSARMEYILMNALLALLEYPGSTLLGVSRILTDKTYRKKVVDNIKDPSVKAYWTDEFAKYSETYVKDAVPGIQNKLGQFTSNPLIRNIIGQPHSSFNLREMMDDRKIFIVNLSKGQLGEGNANLLGGMIITKIYLAAMSRADLTEGELKKLPNFYMYVDEFQSFANESFADILSEARKYKLALVVAHQYIKQMDEKVADAVFGNVGTQIMFRVGAPDAEVLEKEYAPVFTAEDMVSLGFAQIYLKLMIDGVASHPFSATTLPPIAPPAKSFREQVIESSRELYGRPRLEVEKAISDWYGTESEVSHPSPSKESLAPAAQATENLSHPIAPVSDTSRQSQSVVRRSNMIFERERHIARERDEEAEQISGEPVLNPDQQARKKMAQPFAEAFKNISPKTEHRAEHHGVRTAAPQQKPAHPPHTGKGSGPGSPHLSSLKSALADVLAKEKKSTVPGSQPVPAPRPAQQPQPKQQIKVQEEKVAETSEGKKTESAYHTEPHIPHEESRKPQEESPKIKEVPEDVLTALLRGDD